ncbi:MAG: hypothetical protein R3B72_06715 [Polyangiaceae bacterium]
MAELVLRLVVDPKTGKRSLVVDYRSDADALPMEHEDAHLDLVKALVGGAASEAERVAEAPPTAAEEGLGSDQAETAGLEQKA